MKHLRIGLNNERYASLDGLRAYAAIGIVLMHIKGNSHYDIEGAFFEQAIPSFTNFVFLFMMISAFATCCGYYDKISNNKIAIGEFYNRRFRKILPFFAIVVLLDFLMNPNLETLAETIANATLMFGLLPNVNFSVIGVGWFLGVAFLFYMLFPFFCYLIRNKKMAWITMGVSIFYNISCELYFMDGRYVVENFNYRTNILYCSMFFVVGGLIYLYRDNLSKGACKYRWGLLGLIWISSIIYFSGIGSNIINGYILNVCLLLMFGLYLIYAIGTDGILLNNPITRFLASISLEIYLCHMLVFRVVEKLGLSTVSGTGWWSYVITTGLVLGGSIVFAYGVRVLFRRLEKRAKGQKNEGNKTKYRN